jgi:hypothetical protein
LWEARYWSSPGCCGIQSTRQGTKPGTAAASRGSQAGHGPEQAGPCAIHLALVIKNYLKQGDSMTLIFDKAQKQLLQVQIASYMDDPKDAMNLTVQQAAEWPEPCLQHGDRRGQQAAEHCQSKLELPAPLSSLSVSRTRATSQEVATTLNRMHRQARTAAPVLVCLPIKVVEAGDCQRC